jgi:hypothetical protein
LEKSESLIIITIPRELDPWSLYISYEKVN